MYMYLESRLINNDVQRGVQFKITNPSSWAVERSLFESVNTYSVFLCEVEQNIKPTFEMFI